MLKEKVMNRRVFFVLLCMTCVRPDYACEKTAAKGSAADVASLDGRAIEKYARDAVERLGRVKSVSDIDGLFDLAERIGEVRKAIVVGYVKMPAIVGLNLRTPAARDAYARRAREDERQVSLRDARRLMVAMLILQTSAVLRDAGAEARAKLMKEIARKALLTDREADCLLRFQEVRRLPQEDPGLAVREACDEEVSAFLSRVKTLDGE